MQSFVRSVLQAILAAGLCLFLAGCAPVQPAPAHGMEVMPPLRDFFTATELEAALILADVSPDEAGDALCSADPERPEHLTTCVQYGPELGPLDAHQWWIATWDMESQQVVIQWRSNVEVQLQPEL